MLKNYFCYVGMMAGHLMRSRTRQAILYFGRGSHGQQNPVEQPHYEGYSHYLDTLKFAPPGRGRRPTMK